jgi:hypothetical protein
MSLSQKLTSLERKTADKLEHCPRCFGGGPFQAFTRRPATWDDPRWQGRWDELKVRNGWEYLTGDEEPNVPPCAMCGKAAKCIIFDFGCAHEKPPESAGEEAR